MAGCIFGILPRVEMDEVELELPRRPDSMIMTLLAATMRRLAVILALCRGSGRSRRFRGSSGTLRVSGGMGSSGVLRSSLVSFVSLVSLVSLVGLVSRLSGSRAAPHGGRRSQQSHAGGDGLQDLHSE
jgi:hypothetical protein